MTLLQLPAPTINTWFSYVLWFENRFQIENRLKFRELPLDFRKFFPIEKFFFEKFQNYRRELSKSSLDRRFYIEKCYNGALFDTWIKLHVTSYLITCSLYGKTSCFKVFQYKISDRMSYLTALYDNFEIFRKKIFNGEEFSKIEGQFAKFQPIFNLKTVLNSQKMGESSVNRRRKSRHIIFFPLSHSLP